jgi:hypothetical protein
MMKHLQSEDVLRRVRAFTGLIMFHIELHDFSCRSGSDGTTNHFMSHLIDFFAGQRTAIDTGWVLLGDRWHLPRFGELSLASCM